MLRRPGELAEAEATPLPLDSQYELEDFQFTNSLTAIRDDDDHGMLIDATNSAPSVLAAGLTQSSAPELQIDEEGRPKFPPAKEVKKSHSAETRKVLIPPHRMTPLKSAWLKIYPPLVENLKLQVRMNVSARAVEMRTSKYTFDGCLQRGEDFVKAFCLGFDVEDAIALLRLDDLYIETFSLS